ncbi:hypothetical protein FKM82_029109 [Ascaphus truei]
MWNRTYSRYIETCHLIFPTIKPALSCVCVCDASFHSMKRVGLTIAGDTAQTHPEVTSSGSSRGTQSETEDAKGLVTSAAG